MDKQSWHESYFEKSQDILILHEESFLVIGEWISLSFCQFNNNGSNKNVASTN